MCIGNGALVGSQNPTFQEVDNTVCSRIGNVRRVGHPRRQYDPLVFVTVPFQLKSKLSYKMFDAVTQTRLFRFLVRIDRLT